MLRTVEQKAMDYIKRCFRMERFWNEMQGAQIQSFLRNPVRYNTGKENCLWSKSLPPQFFQNSQSTDIRQRHIHQKKIWHMLLYAQKNITACANSHYRNMAIFFCNSPH